MHTYNKNDQNNNNNNNNNNIDQKLSEISCINDITENKMCENDTANSSPNNNNINIDKNIINSNNIINNDNIGILVNEGRKRIQERLNERNNERGSERGSERGETSVSFPLSNFTIGTTIESHTPSPSITANSTGFTANSTGFPVLGMSSPILAPSSDDDSPDVSIHHLEDLNESSCNDIDVSQSIFVTCMSGERKRGGDKERERERENGKDRERGAGAGMGKKRDRDVERERERERERRMSMGMSIGMEAGDDREGLNDASLLHSRSLPTPSTAIKRKHDDISFSLSVYDTSLCGVGGRNGNRSFQEGFTRLGGERVIGVRSTEKNSRDGREARGGRGIDADNEVENVSRQGGGREEEVEEEEVEFGVFLEETDTHFTSRRPRTNSIR
jgi:hypothetical protein